MYWAFVLGEVVPCCLWSCVYLREKVSVRERERGGGGGGRWRYIDRLIKQLMNIEHLPFIDQPVKNRSPATDKV